jgi:outer membrane protein assembly factor BamB
LEDGKPLGYRDTQFPAGNLIAVGGQILSQSATTLSVAHGQLSLQPMVDAALQSNPNDFQAVVRKAELLLQEGDLVGSLKWLDRARQMDPDDVDVENLSVQAMLSALRADFAANQNLLPELERLIYWPADQVELIKLQVRSSLQRGESVDAIKRLIALSQLVSREPSLASVGRSTPDDSARQVSLDGWLAARVFESAAVATQSQSAEIDRLIENHLDDAIGAATPLMKRLLVHFGGQAGARSLTNKLLDRYRDDGAYLAMERLVLGATVATPETIDRLAPWQRERLAEIYARGGLVADATAMLSTISPDQDAGRLLESMALSPDDLTRLSAATRSNQWGQEVTVRLPQEMIRVRGTVIKPVVGKTRRAVGETFKGWHVVSDQSSPFAIRDPLGAVYPIPLDGMNRRDDMTRQAVFSGGMMVAMMPGELVGVDLFQVMRGQIDSVIWRRPWRSDSSGGGIKPRSESTKFGDQIYRYVISGAGGDVGSTELVLGPIVGDMFFVLQGNELIAYDTMTAEPRWRNIDTPRGGAIVSDGKRVAVVSTNSKTVVHFDCRDGRRLEQLPLEDYQIWASTDQAVLMYRDVNETTRDLVLYDPIAGKDLLRHQYTDLSANNRVFGRVINGAYVVTLTAAGDVLAWDIQNRREISKLKIEPIELYKGLHVIAHNDSIVLLPNTSAPSEDDQGTAVQTTSGQDHVRVDSTIINLSLADGKIAWQYNLSNGPWGCTITQSSVTPVLLLSRSKSRYLSTGSRTKTLDVQAIDFRTGKSIQTFDQPVESFSNDIETVVTVQPTQQQVLVSIGNLRLEYLFSDPVKKTDADAGDADTGDGDGDAAANGDADAATKQDGSPSGRSNNPPPSPPALDDLFE